MKTITQYKEEIKNLLDECSKFDARATAEGRDLNATEIKLKNEMMDLIEDRQETVKALERQERIQNGLTVDPQNTRQHALTVQGSDLNRQVRDKDRFVSFGEQMAAIMRAGLPGGQVDPRLFNAATGLSETVPSDGGFLVQSDFTSELLKEIFATGILASRCRRIQLSGNSNSIKINGVDETSRATGSRGGGITGYWADEAAEKTASKPKFRKIELILKKLIGLCYATDELLDDAVALEGYIRQGFVDEFGFLIDDALINGTGAGQPLGVLNAGCLVSVAKETGQTAATVVAENVINMFSRIFASSRANAAWFINQNVEPQLMQMSLAVGTGGQLIYMPPGGLSQAPYGNLLGLPVIPIEQAATLGTVGDIILGDFNRGYILAEKGGIKSNMSIHVKFIYDESVFRFVLRIDGQPVRASAMTPYKGGASYTQSHFVALATRA